MYLLPSTSTSVAPEPRLMKIGDPPTDLNARTGLSTPPGRSCCARAKRRCDRVVFMETTLCHRSVGRRTLRMVDDDDGHERVVRLQRQSELLAKRGDEAGSGIGVLGPKVVIA